MTALEQFAAMKRQAAPKQFARRAIEQGRPSLDVIRELEHQGMSYKDAASLVDDVLDEECA